VEVLLGLPRSSKAFPIQEITS